MGRAQLEKAPCMFSQVMWFVAGVVIGAGAVAVIVWCPAVATAIECVLNSPITKKIISEALQLLLPLVKEAVTGMYTSKDQPWDDSLYAVVSKFSPTAYLTE